MLEIIIGLFGMALVMLSFNITFVQFYHQLLGAVGISDLVIGLIKAGVFGLLIAGIGCQQDLHQAGRRLRGPVGHRRRGDEHRTDRGH